MTLRGGDVHTGAREGYELDTQTQRSQAGHDVQLYICAVSSLSLINLSGLISLKLVSGLCHLSDWLAFISAAV